MKSKAAHNLGAGDAIRIIYDTRMMDLAGLYLPSLFNTKM